MLLLVLLFLKQVPSVCGCVCVFFLRVSLVRWPVHDVPLALKGFPPRRILLTVFVRGILGSAAGCGCFVVFCLSFSTKLLFDERLFAVRVHSRECWHDPTGADVTGNPEGNASDGLMGGWCMVLRAQQLGRTWKKPCVRNGLHDAYLCLERSCTEVSEQPEGVMGLGCSSTISKLRQFDLVVLHKVQNHIDEGLLGWAVTAPL